jgi:hypothetical protein
MPVECFVDVEHRLVRSRFSGIVKLTEILRHITDLSANPIFHPDFVELITFAGANLQLSYLDVRAIAQRDPFSETSKRAFVIPTKGAIYGVIRMYQTIRDGSPYIQIFPSVSDAMLWLKFQPNIDFLSSFPV